MSREHPQRDEALGPAALESMEVRPHAPNLVRFILYCCAHGAGGEMRVAEVEMGVLQGEEC